MFAFRPTGRLLLALNMGCLLRGLGQELSGINDVFRLPFRGPPQHPAHIAKVSIGSMGQP